MKARDRTEERTPSRPGQIAGRRRGGAASVLALQQMAGNQAVSKLMRRTPKKAPTKKKPFDDPSFHEAPEGVTAGANALPAGATTADAATATIKDGKVGKVDRVLLDGLPGSMGDSWGGADKGHISGVGKGKRGHRGRAVAAVPHGMKADGPLTLVIHLHGMDINGLTGTSGMRETGDRPEDVSDFQIPQQLQAFAGKHQGSRVAVLMPLGVTVPGSVAFGIDDWDKYIDEALGQMGLSHEAVTVYLSAHSGGGFTLSSLLSNPKWGLKTHRLGGVFAFESFHKADVELWEKIINQHLDHDLAELKKRQAGSADQLSYLRNDGFRFAAFAGSASYTGNLTKLRKTVLAWFTKNNNGLAAATGGKAEVLNMLWRNYQVKFDQAGHMAALSANSHFESMLESIADRGPAAAVKAPTPAPVPKPAAPTAPTRVHAPTATPPSPATTAKEHHGPDPVQAKTKRRPEPKPKPLALTVDQLRQAAIDQAALTDAERELVAAGDSAAGNLSAVKQKIADIDKQRKRKKITSAKAKEAKAPLIEEQATAQKAYGAAAKKISKHVKAKADMEKALVKALPQHAANPHKAVEAWFGDIVPDATFLGHRIEAEGSVSPGVHKELLAKLKVAEQDLKGKTVTIHSIGGLRPPSPATGGTLPSYHCFGLAIDIDAGSNPFVRGDTEPVVMRATLLVKGAEYDPLKAPDKDVGAQWTAMKAASDALRDYFALRGEGAETKIEALLKAHPGARAHGDAAAWKKTIEDDLARLKKTGTWRRGDPAKTMLSLDKDLVLALTRAGLTWGGMYKRPQDGRDLMHFDWRDGTIQQR